MFRTSFGIFSLSEGSENLILQKLRLRNHKNSIFKKL